MTNLTCWLTALADGIKVSDLATPAIALLVAVITIGQWVTNRARLRHELFDRRYDVYEKVAGFISEVLRSGTVVLGADDEFNRRTKRAYFVFGCDPKVKSLLDDIYQHARHLHTLQAKENNLSGQALNKNIDKQNDEKEWFRSMLDELEHSFERYLRLRH
jgi:hypothetical protein